MTNTWIPEEDAVEALGHAIMLGRWQAGTEKWLEARAKGITGTDLGAITGVNPWKTADDLLREKLDPAAAAIEPTLPMQFGSAFEGGILKVWKQANKDWLDAHTTGTWQSLRDRSHIANPDALIRWHDGTLGVLEIKYTARKWDRLPEYYRLQVLWYLHVLGLRKAVLVQVYGHTMTEWAIDYDEETLDNALAAVKRFQNRLLGD
jgi:putative phage-type endonuclease